jgi:hypothetical protein
MTSVQTKIPDQPIGVPRQIHTYAGFRQQIHHDLRTQHPEWVEPNGECPECDEHEARLRELLDSLTRTGSDESPLLRAEIGGVDRQMESAASDKGEGSTRPHSSRNSS